ncbi:MAG: hypothetical protein ACLP56_07355 [Candidatus Sulfotelmatobacter sp.]
MGTVPKQTTSQGGAAAVPVKPGLYPKEDSLAVLKTLAEASAVFIALTFVGGWSYLASYYKTFGLNPLELDISIPVVSTTAVYVLYESVWPLFVAGALIMAIAIVARRMPGTGRGWTVAALGVLLLSTAIAGVFRGRQVANQDILANSRNLPNVAFASKLTNPEPSCVEHETYGSMDCKLLLHFKGTYYFFQPVHPGIGSLNLYMLSDSDLVGVHIQRGLDQNEESK